MPRPWRNQTERDAAYAHLAEDIPGWRTPVAWGIGWVDRSEFDFTRVNLAEFPLAALILATVARHPGGTGAYRLGEAALAEAITRLEPDERYTWDDHPNLAAWRRLAHQLGAGTSALAVFVGDWDAGRDDPHVAGLITAALAGRAENPDGTTTLWRPAGPAELSLVEASEWKAWPPRLVDQPIFYPVLNEAYAVRIARDWNVPASGDGYVTRFHVDTDYARTLPTRRAGGEDMLELWVPAADIDTFNSHIVGTIEVLHRFQ